MRRPTPFYPSGCGAVKLRQASAIRLRRHSSGAARPPAKDAGEETLSMNDVTPILSAIEQGDPKAAEQLLPLVYNDLRNLAIQKLGRVPPGQPLQPPALVHKAYLRLVGGGDQLWDSRGHFFAAAAEAMRRILVENARKK